MTGVFKRCKTFIKSPQGFFVAIGSIFGILFLLALPPLQTPDETVHFLRAYEVSEGKFVSKKVNGKTGDYLPRSIQRTVGVLEGATPIQFHPERKYDHRQTKSALYDIPLEKENRKFYETASASTYSPVGYIPQSIAVFLVRLFDGPVVLMIYAARAASLAAWLILGFFAIKLFPWKKWAIVGIALLPMMLAQSVSPGVDALSIGSGLVFMAAVFNTFHNKQLEKRKLMAILIVSGIAMVAAKQIMLVLLPMVFLIKNEYLTDNSKIKAIVLKLTVLSLPLLALLLWSMFTSDISSSAAQLSNGQNTVEQVKYLIQSPWEFLVVIYNTFFFTWGDGVIGSVIGNFGWVDTPLSAAFLSLGYVMVAFYLLVNYEPRAKMGEITKKQRYAVLALAGVYILAVCAAMYVYYSPVKFDIIVGIQGRYFFPALFLLLPALFTAKIIAPRHYFIKYTILATIFLLSVSLITIVYRYYITYL